MKQDQRGKLLLFRLIVVMLSVGTALVIAELLVRILLPASAWQFRDATADWQLDSQLGWVQKPNLDDTSPNTLGEYGWTVHFQTNADGLTPYTAQRTKRPGVTRVMIFGDSTVVGRAVPQEKTIHVWLQKLLRSNVVDTEVINAGVQGYSTDQVLLRIQQLVPLYRPDVIVYALCSNDFGGNVSREAYGAPKPVFVLNGNGTLEEFPPDLTKRDGIPSFGSGPRAWIQHSALYRFFHPQITGLRAKLLGWSERNLLGMAPDIYYRPEAMEEINWLLFVALLKEMNVFSRGNGAKFFFYAHPGLEEVWNPYIGETEHQLHLKPGQYDRYALEKRLRQSAKSASVLFCPMIDYFLANQQRGPFHLLPRDPHANPAGYQLQAEVLAKCMLDVGLLAERVGHTNS